MGKSPDFESGPIQVGDKRFPNETNDAFATDQSLSKAALILSSVIIAGLLYVDLTKWHLARDFSSGLTHAVTIVIAVKNAEDRRAEGGTVISAPTLAESLRGFTDR